MPSFAVVRAALAMTACAALPAVAAPTVYTDRATFLAALSGAPTVQDYESIPADLWGTEVSVLGSTTSTYVLGAVTLESPSGINADRDFALSNTQLNTGFSSPDIAADRRLTVTLSLLVNAIGIDLIDYQSPDTAGSDPLTITAFGLSTQVDGNPSAGTPDFFGIIDPSATTSSLVISRADQVFYPLTFDNITFAAAADVPEPASIGVVALAGALLARTRRRRG